MSLDQLKTQLMTVLMVKDHGESSMLMMVITMVAISCIDHFFRVVPTLVELMKKCFLDLANKQYTNRMGNDEKILSKIRFEKCYESGHRTNVVDGVLHYICKLDSATELCYNEFYIVNWMNPFMVTGDIKARVISKTYNNESKNISSLIFEIYSTTQPLSFLKEWVSKVCAEYEREKTNNFKGGRFYFDEMVGKEEIAFAMTEFCTNKSLSNTYGKHIRLVKERLDFFLNHPEWYASKGIPHTLGILLYGPPGTGKTSLIKAIAKDTCRHVVNIKLRPNTDPAELSRLFFHNNLYIQHRDRGYLTSLTVPIQERVYVIEDIDCLSDIVCDRGREEKKEERREDRVDFFGEDEDVGREEKEGKGEEEKGERKGGKSVKKGKLTLSFILNLLDGVLETPGRILIMTSNYPERLDKALTRPGRIDINLKLGYCDDDMVREMYEKFYDRVCPVDLSFDTGHSYTPAEVQEVLCNYYNNPEQAYRVLMREKVDEEDI